MKIYIETDRISPTTLETRVLVSSGLRTYKNSIGSNAIKIILHIIVFNECEVKFSLLLFQTQMN